ncbi:hypothetical protein OB955_07440 [Halobacteria archaeon AArc-m2/3/4]|uniref:Uncharacterized protein n=1 Tax=Natronoglomus mannanivorans TaxID=2979990 RepID=A0AAP3E1C5_9EURY|nr:hypothetical protein [Halobacteria archaeon AArc-xg1-1]MCU4972571.1 hypothetical protein [Halobacteria archaeon AArc-m2/3/4]
MSPTSWSLDRHGLARFPGRVAVTLAGLPVSLFSLLFVALPLAGYAAVVAVGPTALEFAVIGWSLSLLFVWLTSRGAARIEYELDPDRRVIAVDDVRSPDDATVEIDCSTLERVRTVSLPGLDVTVVVTGGWAETTPSWVAVPDGDRHRVRSALSAAGVSVPTDGSEPLADPLTTRIRGTLLVVGLALTVVVPAVAFGVLLVDGQISPTLFGGIGLVFSGLFGLFTLDSRGVLPEYGDADGFLATARTAVTRSTVSLVGIGLGMGAFSLAVWFSSALL